MPSEITGNLLYIQAITLLHPGSGTALGAIDLPVQRERHTGWPTIPGSSIKGVLRDAAMRAENPRVDVLFGKARDGLDDGGFAAGVLSFTDARLLAFPVRSLHGVFALVTCPAAVSRWWRDSALIAASGAPPTLSPPMGEAICHQGCPCVSNGKAILEEFEFTTKLAPAPLTLPQIPGLDGRRVVVLHDDDFTHFAIHATEVTARIRLNAETKTVDRGALFYEESLPSETLLYSLVLRSSRGSNVAWEPPQFAQIGGDETIGKGLCALTLS